MVALTAYLNDKVEEGLFPKFRVQPVLTQILFYLTFPLWIVLAYLATLKSVNDKN